MLQPAFSIPPDDATPEGLARLREENEAYRKIAWPKPFDATTHSLHEGDARDLSWLSVESVHLVVTSPPYVMPLHADIQVRSRALGLDCLTPILWHKIANGVTEADGNGAGFYGKPYQPGAIVKNDIEHILFMRKGGTYRSPAPLQKALSVLTKREMQSWWKSIWSDIKGASTRAGHPAPYPIELAERLIRMFSFAGDTVFDPFAGTASTSLAAVAAGRNSISNEIERTYLKIAHHRLIQATKRDRLLGAVRATVHVDTLDKRSLTKAKTIALPIAGPLPKSV